MSPDHHMGEQNTPLSRVRETEEPPEQGKQKKPEREKAEERETRGNGEDEENGWIMNE